MATRGETVAARTPPVLRAAGLSDVGRKREVNEDRLHIDSARGIFLVVDGVGGHAEGGRAADIAVQLIRERLERQTGATADRVREAITIANNGIYHAALQHPEWRGMACVLTVAVVEHGRIVVGHVGDTRMYVLEAGRVRKVTPDHSPVGEREDAREISERDAMRHPRRNEVFRDVGSTLRHPDDADFAFVGEIDLPDDGALLICSDGLTDLVPIAVIERTVAAHRGRPQDVAQALVAAANQAGGKDNVTVVYVESGGSPAASAAIPRARRSMPALALLLIAVALAALGWTAMQAGWWTLPAWSSVFARVTATAPIVVRGGDSIAAAIEQATPGTTVLVEPGDYRERLVMRDGVRVVSRVPRAATLRLPGSATERDAAVVATGVTGAELVGFRIVGDASSPLGTGVLVRHADLRLADLEISGATVAAVELGPEATGTLLGSEVFDNPGAALVVRDGARPRIAHNTFSRNAASPDALSALLIEPGAEPRIQRNVFEGADAQALVGADHAIGRTLARHNWFVGLPAAAGAVPAPGAGQ